SLVEASIDQYGEPVLGRELSFLEINKAVGHEKLFRLYVQYAHLDDYLGSFSDRLPPWVSRASESLLFSGFHFDLDPSSTLTAEGYTNIHPTGEHYLMALQGSGRAARSIPEIAPQRTALYISYGFDSFGEFHRNFEKVLQRDSLQFASYTEGVEQIEGLLKIDLGENFVSWIGEEIALLQLQSRISKGKNELALILKAKDAQRAQGELAFIVDQIRKRTPVKFKTVEYKGHQINFLAIKGMFKLLFGGRFEALDKPYFTQMGEYVIFSDDPNTLKGIIDDVKTGQTLAGYTEFMEFDKRFETESSIFIYGNVPLFYEVMYAMADGETKGKMELNKDYIVCFPQFGFQMSPRGDLFGSRMVIEYREPGPFQSPGSMGQGDPRSARPARAPVQLDPTEEIFDLPPIYPADLNAKRFVKRYADGSIHIVVELKEGVKHGSYVEYHPNGRRKISGRFRQDRQVGTWRYYDREGRILLRKRF